MARLHVVGEWHSQGEKLTADHLAEHLPDAWVVVANREVYQPRGPSVDLDFVVVGFRRVFVIEDKYWRGRVELDDAPKWLHEGRLAGNPLRQARSGARVLNGRLEDRVEGWEAHAAGHQRDGHLLTGHVMLSHPRVRMIDDKTPGTPVLGRDAVLRLADAPRRLLALDANTSAVLPDDLRRRLVEHLAGLRATTGDGWPAELGGYLRDGDPVRRGTVTVLPVRAPSGLRLELSCVAVEGDIDVEDERRIATREYEALEALATSGRAWRVRDWFRWESYIVTPFVAEDDGTSLRESALLGATDHNPETIVADAFAALAEVHERGIAHRALAPSSIEIDPGGRVRFRDFARSRIAAAGTVSSLLDEDPSDAYAPPGQRLGWRDERDDVYSLALCLALWLTGDPGDTPDHDACRALLSGRGNAVGRGLARALDADRGRRPDAAAVVILVSGPASPPPPSSPIPDVPRYEFIRRIGAGSMGEVWHARDHELAGRDVAVKRLPTGVTLDPAQVERFTREARLLAGLRHHPHIITLLDWQVRETELHLAMPLVEGIDLAKELRDRGPMTSTRALVIVDQLAQALDSAHAAGLVHRDVKPANVLLDGAYRGDFVYLIDFGIASGGTLSMDSQHFLGTPFYMAPERFDPTSVVDRRADVYSLGCLLHELLTGAPPFVGEVGRVISAHMHDSPPRPATVPTPVSDVVGRAMEKSPADRYQSAGELSGALRGAIAARPSESTRSDRPSSGISRRERQDAIGVGEEAKRLLARAYHELDAQAAIDAYRAVVTCLDGDANVDGAEAMTARALLGAAHHLAAQGRREEALHACHEVVTRYQDSTGAELPGLVNVARGRRRALREGSPSIRGLNLRWSP